MFSAIKLLLCLLADRSWDLRVMKVGKSHIVHIGLRECRLTESACLTLYHLQISAVKNGEHNRRRKGKGDQPTSRTDRKLARMVSLSFPFLQHRRLLSLALLHSLCRLTFTLTRVALLSTSLEYHCREFVRLPACYRADGIILTWHWQRRRSQIGIR